MSLRNDAAALPARGRWHVAGSVAELRRDERLLTKVDHLPVVVVEHAGELFAIEDRCPHLGFPLHQGTVESGMITCHWHHARFDLASGCTLDPWADDAVGFEARVAGEAVEVRRRQDGQDAARLRTRLADGLEHGITLVVAKAILGLVEAGVAPQEIVAEIARFGLANRADGWSSGMTTLVALADLVPLLDTDDRAMALIHGAAEVAASTAGRAPRFPERPLDPAGVPPARLAQWFRRFVDTRTADAAERSLATLADADHGAAGDALAAAITDHVFIDEGHTLDFANKAAELATMVEAPLARSGLTSLVAQACAADRAEESSQWQHPVDLVALLDTTTPALLAALAGDRRAGTVDVAALASTVVEAEPAAVATALVDAAGAGATLEELGRAVAHAAALRLLRFHTRNDVSDWNTVHHTFTTANGLHQLLARRPTPELARAIPQVALRVYLDRFLNVPAARPPTEGPASLDELAACWDVQGEVDRTGTLVFRLARQPGGTRRVIAALGHALLQEDAGFHAYQIVEAGATHALAWPPDGEPAANALAGVARFLAAHTPTRRERRQVVRTAQLMRRGGALHEDGAPQT